MYNFNLEKNEEVVSIFDEVLIKHDDNQRIVSVAITNKRILILDYQSIEPLETLKGAHASSYIKMKEVIFSKYLKEIKSIKGKDLYEIMFKDNYIIEFDNDDLYSLLSKK
jgi:hypothetical protein